MDCQYCIILQQGNDKGIRQYVWASETQIETAQNRIKKMKIKEFCDVSVNENDDGLLNIIAINEENANEFAKILELPKPFVKIGDKYVLKS